MMEYYKILGGESELVKEKINIARQALTAVIDFNKKSNKRLPYGELIDAVDGLEVVRDVGVRWEFNSRVKYPLPMYLCPKIDRIQNAIKIIRDYGFNDCEFKKVPGLATPLAKALLLELNILEERAELWAAMQ